MIDGFTREQLCGVWSATPTPLTEDLALDLASIEPTIEHHMKLDIRGLFVAGSCGEGPWMPTADRRELVREVARHAKGKMAIAVQVTDNSAARIIENAQQAAEDGADMVVIAQPFFLLNATPETLRELYLTAVEESPLPVGMYDLGERGPRCVPAEIMTELYRLPKVVMVKDSSGDTSRRDMALAARDDRPELLLLDGDEFHCVEYLEAGYDGLLLGGGVFNGHLAWQVIRAVEAGDIEAANAIQARMNRLMYDVYGGEDISCWLSGQKRLLVGMGVFQTWRNHLNYPLTPECEQAIERALVEDRDALFPWEG